MALAETNPEEVGIREPEAVEWQGEGVEEPSGEENIHPSTHLSIYLPLPAIPYLSDLD